MVATCTNATTSANGCTALFDPEAPADIPATVDVTYTYKRARRAGQTMVEFSVVAVLTAITLLFVVEIGRTVLVYTAVANAARAGVRYAVVHGSSRSTGRTVDSASRAGQQPRASRDGGEELRERRLVNHQPSGGYRNLSGRFQCSRAVRNCQCRLSVRSIDHILFEDAAARQRLTGDHRILRSAAHTFGRREGQAVILVVVAMSILLIGALGLAIDGGQMYAHRQMAQAAADAAAQAGIMSIFDGTNATSGHPFGTGTPPIASSVCTTTDARTPCVYARNNGFGGTSADTVTLSFPATVSGVTLSSGNVPAFAVTVQRTLKTGLIRFIGAGATSTITAKATAGLVGAVSPSCVYALDPSAQNAFQATNGATVALNGCAIAVNSTNNDALTVNGGSTVTASAISVVGGDVISGGSSITPAATNGVPRPPIRWPHCRRRRWAPATIPTIAPAMEPGRSPPESIAAESTSPTAPRLHSRQGLTLLMAARSHWLAEPPTPAAE